MTKIGFIGLGHMGNPMAHNLLSAKFNLYVYDISEAAVKKLSADGAIAQSSIAEMAANMDVIITMVQTGDQVSDLCLRQDGIFANAKKELLYIDCSSIDITVTRSLHAEAKKHQIAMLDSPVSGGVAGATARR